MKIHVILTLLLSAFFLTINLASAKSNSTQNYDPNTVVVKLKQNKRLPNYAEILSSRHLFANTYTLRTKQQSSLVKKLNNNPNVVRLYKNYKSQKSLLPKGLPLPTSILKDSNLTNGPTIFNDKHILKQWSFMPSKGHGVSVNEVYKTLGPSSGETIIVAVVDTGVDYKHPDLKNIMWSNPKEIPGNGIDDDQNGYVDDIHGIDLLSRNSKGVPSGNPMDTHDHGSHVSGIIAAEQNNKLGIAGIASKVKIMAIRAVPNASDETDIDVAEAFIYAAKHGAKIINCSFGKTAAEDRDLVRDTINFIGEKYGVLVIAAAGNSRTDIDKTFHYPASFDNQNLLVVASTTKRGRRSGFSNYGIIGVDVGGPGSAIYSTVRRKRYASMSGTSMASPTVAGVAAEVLSRVPQLNNIELKQVLMNSVTPMKDLDGKTVTGGRVDLFSAISLAESILRLP